MAVQCNFCLFYYIWLMFKVLSADTLFKTTECHGVKEMEL